MFFAIIFTVIIIGFVIAVGIGQIQDFFCIGSDAQTNTAVKNVEVLVDEMFILAKGSAKTYKLSLPSESRICFVNITNPDPHPYQDVSKTWNPDKIIIDEILKNPNSPQFGSNLWIYRCDSKVGEGYKMKYLTPSKSFCAVGNDEILIENKGSFVDISIPE